MENTKEQLRTSIILISDHIGAKNYRTMLETIGYTMPELVKNIVYDMFLANLNDNNCPLSILNQYRTIQEYAKELNQNGFVEFKN
jgi:hypothetical protein